MSRDTIRVHRSEVPRTDGRTIRITQQVDAHTEAALDLTSDELAQLIRIVTDHQRHGDTDGALGVRTDPREDTTP